MTRNVGKYILHPIARLLKPHQEYVLMSISQISILVEDSNAEKLKNRITHFVFEKGE